MNQNLLSTICEMYNLGTPIHEAFRVTGGLIHKVWCLETGKGKYAVKELDSKIMEKADMQSRFDLSESTAQKLFDKGIPALVGLKVEGKFVTKILDTYVIVYEWVDGVTLPTAAASSEQAFQIGEIIAKIHIENLDVPGLNTDMFSSFSDEYWQTLVVDFLNKFPEAALWLSNSDILSWNANAESIIKNLLQHVVVSHGDIDQKNVIWRDLKHPLIIDWESIGKVNPGLELMDAILNWSGLVSGQIDNDSVKAFIDGYNSIGIPIMDSGEEVLRGCMIKWLSWLEFNMKRAIHSGDKEEQYLGFTQTQNTIRSLKLISDNFETLKSLF